MSLKLGIIFALNLLFMNSVLSYDIISKYGSKKVYGLNYVFLDVSGFDVDETIYISVTRYYMCYNYNLYYKFYESTNGYSSGDYLMPTYYTSNSYVSTYNSYEEKFNYEIDKPSSNYKYALLKCECNPPIYFENTEDGGISTVVIIIIVICLIIFIAVIITIIVYCCRRCKRAVYNRVPIPVTPAYGVSPYGVQPVVGVGMVQPVTTVQPYGVNANYIPNQNVNQNYNPTYNNQNLDQNYTPNYNNGNVQYNSAAPVQQGSEVRINQDVRYEKPH